jgi:RNA polymerase sigma-70 factor, ECF subfamily
MAGQISILLAKWQQGENSAMEQLMPLVYDELRKIGRAYFKRHSQQAVLQPTALVNEAWVKLAAKQALPLPTRTHFFALAARIMRNVLTDHYRREHAGKRGGTRVSLSLEDATLAHKPEPFDWLVFDEVLYRLTQIKPRYTEIIELRFFGGLTIEETAETLRISHATVEREWNFARLWLRRELSSNN